MKYLLLPIILLLAACATTSAKPQDIELTGRLFGSYVSTSSGITQGNVLHISDSSSIQRVKSIAKGDPTKILLYGDPESLDGLAGKQVKVVGKIHAEHKDIFHTDFVLSINGISEQ